MSIPPSPIAHQNSGGINAINTAADTNISKSPLSSRTGYLTPNRSINTDIFTGLFMEIAPMPHPTRAKSPSDALLHDIPTQERTPLRSLSSGPDVPEEAIANNNIAISGDTGPALAPDRSRQSPGQSKFARAVSSDSNIGGINTFKRLGTNCDQKSNIQRGDSSTVFAQSRKEKHAPVGSRSVQTSTSSGTNRHQTYDTLTDKEKERRDLAVRHLQTSWPLAFTNPHRKPWWYITDPNKKDPLDWSSTLLQQLQLLALMTMNDHPQAWRLIRQSFEKRKRSKTITMFNSADVDSAIKHLNKKRLSCKRDHENQLNEAITNKRR